MTLDAYLAARPDRCSHGYHPSQRQLHECAETKTDDVARIRAAILADGKAHQGRVDSNRVRNALAGQVQKPQNVGPTYSRLVRAGLLRALGYIDENKDKASRNEGKPALAYELTESGWAA